MKTKYLCPSVKTAQIRISNFCDPTQVPFDPNNPELPRDNASKRSVFGDDWEEF